MPKGIKLTMQKQVSSFTCMVSIVLSVVACSNYSTPGRIPTSIEMVATLPQTVTTTIPVISTPTNTITPVATLSPTLYPTVPTEEVLPTILSLYEDNGGCELPCWWGIIPGETSWSITRARFSSLSRFEGPYVKQSIENYYLNFVLPENIDRFGNLNVPGGAPGTYVGVYVENDTVKSITLWSYFVTRDFDYSLSGLLRKIGQPEEIWLKAVAESSDNQPYYYLDLFYPSRGILISLNGNAKKQQDLLVFCPQDYYTRENYPPSLLLWSPGIIKQYHEINSILLPGFTFWENKSYRPLKEWSSSMSIEDFYSVYVQTDTSVCLKVGISP